MRGRELKLKALLRLFSALLSPPVRGRELKFIRYGQSSFHPVAPRAGA